MGSTLIIDNWLLQDIGSCISEGLSADTSSELVINRSNDSHSFRDVPLAGVQIEALLEFLVDIVLRDSIVIDSAFTDTWSENESIFSHLLSQGLMRALDLYAYEDVLSDPRKFSLSQLCVTSSLREAQQRNEQSWAATKKADDPYMSQIIWGTAGMLSRSHIFEAPYSGHPIRKRVIEQTILITPPRDAISETRKWVDAERLRLFDIQSENGMQRTAALVLPPIAIEIIDESKDINDLISVAFQMRDKYAPVREWLRLVQMAIDSEDPNEITKYKKTLNAVSNDLNRAMGSTGTGNISLRIGFGWPTISIPVTLDGVKKKFGIRAILNNQIFTPQGENSVKKLLRMFEEEKSIIGLSVLEYLRINRQ